LDFTPKECLWEAAAQVAVAAAVAASARRGLMWVVAAVVALAAAEIAVAVAAPILVVLAANQVCAARLATAAAVAAAGTIMTAAHRAIARTPPSAIAAAQAAAPAPILDALVANQVFEALLARTSAVAAHLGQTTNLYQAQAGHAITLA